MATQLALATLARDLETVRTILAGMTNILQENLVTVSSHDKASQDWRENLLTKAENAVAKVDQIERALEEGNRIQQDHGGIVRGLLGLAPVSNPSPLARDIKEVLAIVRAQHDQDPDTGRDTTGWAYWAPRFKEAWTHGVALAALALLLNMLMPYIREEISPARHSSAPSVVDPPAP